MAAPRLENLAWESLTRHRRGRVADAHVQAACGQRRGRMSQVDFHTWTLLKGVAISTLLGVGANMTFSGESDLVQAIRESTQQNVSRAGDHITSRNLQIRPTITIRPGAPGRLVVHRELILTRWKE